MSMLKPVSDVKCIAGRCQFLRTSSQVILAAVLAGVIGDVQTRGQGMEAAENRFIAEVEAHGGASVFGLTTYLEGHFSWWT